MYAPIEAAAALSERGSRGAMRPAGIDAIGLLAARLLRHEARTFVVLGGGSQATYLRDDDEIVWLGRRGTALHRRAAIVAALPRLRPGTLVWSDHRVLRLGARPLFDLGDGAIWEPQPVGPLASNAERRARLRWLAQIAVSAEAALPRVLAGALLGLPDMSVLPGDPFFVRAAALLLPMTRAVGAIDLPVAAERVLDLVGFGPGLTPSGDDVASGFLFALACAPRSDRLLTPLRAAVERVAHETHPLSLALLRDCMRGHAAAPAHELARAVLSADAAPPSPAAVGRLLAIGQRSGGDLLAGLLVGLHVGSVSCQMT